MPFKIQSKLLFCLLFEDINLSCYPNVAFLKSVSIEYRKNVLCMYKVDIDVS